METILLLLETDTSNFGTWNIPVGNIRYKVYVDDQYWLYQHNKYDNDNFIIIII